MKLLNRMLARLRMRLLSGQHTFALDEPLRTTLAGWRVSTLDESLRAALNERAALEQRPPEQVQTELLEMGLADLQAADLLKACWNGLARREQDVTALTCLGLTNRQMAGRMGVMPDTVKGYIRQTLIRWNVSSKEELRILLRDWDFSAWAQPMK